MVPGLKAILELKLCSHQTRVVRQGCPVSMLGQCRDAIRGSVAVWYRYNFGVAVCPEAKYLNLAKEDALRQPVMDFGP